MSSTKAVSRVRKPDDAEGSADSTEAGSAVQVPTTAVPSPADTGMPAAALFEPEDDAPPELPAVDAHSVEAATARASTTNSGSGQAPGGGSASGVVDKDGRPFDPSIHETGADGSPRLTSSGKCRKKRGGGGGGASRSRLDIPPPGSMDTQGPTVDAAELERKIGQSAAAATAMTFTLAQVIGGKDFAPITPQHKDPQFPDLNEPQEMHGAYVDLFRAYGVVDLPPWAAFGFYMSVVVARRWNKEEFVKRKETWREKFKHWWVSRSERKKREKRERQAQQDKDDRKSAPKANELGLPSTPP